MLDTYIERILAGKCLTEAESYQATLLLLSKKTTPDQIITYLQALHKRGEKPSEILGVIAALKAQMIPLPVTKTTLDIVGTGGDNANSINVSTGASILAASCGVPIVKHGNRAVSSATGSADLLEALGVDIEMSPEKMLHALETLNITFCFAPRFHTALAQLKDIRRQIGARTIFNLVGPFLNPASCEHYLIGVPSVELLKTFADILSALPIKKSAVVHSDGMDELTCSGITHIIEVNEGKQKSYVLEPAEVGLARCDKSALKGGDAAYNAKTLKEVFAKKTGPVADTIILNAAMGIYLYGKEKNLSDAVLLVKNNLQAGKAMELLENWTALSKSSSL